MASKAPIVDDLFVVQGAMLDAPDNSPAEKNAFKARSILLRHMTPEQKRRATIIAAAVLHLTI